jgi:transposase
LPEDERLAIERHPREFDRLGEDLKVIERDLARSALADEGAKRLMTIPGVDMVVALAMAAISEVGGSSSRRSWSATSGTGLSRTDHQAVPRPRRARRGRLSARYLARVLPARASPMRPACRRRRDRP